MIPARSQPRHAATTAAVDAVRPRRGRPPGSQTRLLHAAGGDLGRHHFAFLRALVDGVELEAAWRRYLAFTGGPQDHRHVLSRLRHLVAALERGGAHRGCQQAAAVVVPALRALPDLRRSRARSGAGKAGRGDFPEAAGKTSAWPTLEAWRASQCGASGIDEDFYTESEWAELYVEAFGRAPARPDEGAGKAGQLVPAPSPALSATTHVRMAETVAAHRPGVAAGQRKAVLQSLGELERSLAREASLSDEVAFWLDGGIPHELATVGVRTLGDLVGFVNLNGHRWHRRVPRLGAVRAQRLLAWLTPLAAAQGQPVKDAVRRPQTDLAELRRQGLVTIATGRFPRLLPVEGVVNGTPRGPEAATGQPGGAVVDGTPGLADRRAIAGWLDRYQGQTLRDYTRVAERFCLWCLLVRRKGLADLEVADVQAYRAFVAEPPADWVQSRMRSRDDPDWRPFRGPLVGSSQRHEFAVLNSLFGALVDQGHLLNNVIGRAARAMKLPPPSVGVDRSLDAEQWAFARRVLQEKPDTSQRRRLELLLELLRTTGLRLSELATARVGALRQEVVDGQAAWLLDVVGRAGRRRSVVVPDHVRDLIEQHHLDMQAAGVGFDPRVLAPITQSQETSDLESGKPLVGILRRPPPRRRLDRLGVPFVDREQPTQADRHGALERSAIYKLLRRFFEEVAEAAAGRPGAPSADGFRRASTHWLRHTFAASAVRSLPPPVVQRLLGHGDLRIVSAYVKADSSELVRSMRALRGTSSGRQSGSGD